MSIEFVRQEHGIINSFHRHSIRKGNVSLPAEHQHLSLIVYAIPYQRALNILPDNLIPEVTIKDGEKVSWLSIASYLDRGSRADGQGAFEQTIYWLHVLCDGQPAHWLFGISLGSLSAVAARNLWSMPWHLSAMEFQIKYDLSEGRYRNYRLQTQSQWANSRWDIADTGESIISENIVENPLPQTIFAGAFNNLFTRTDGALGVYRIRYSDLGFTSGKITAAQSDLLEKLELLDKDEIYKPQLVLLQRRVTCQIFSPQVVSANSFSARQTSGSPRGGRAEFAFAS